MADDLRECSPPRPFDLSKYKVHVVKNYDSCRSFTHQLKRHCENYPVLGFDCEWRPNFDSSVPRRKVALLQLASADGLCILVQLKLLSDMPPELRDLLDDPRILKVGVEPLEDGSKLEEDYGLSTSGTIDLRALAHRLCIPEPYGLRGLAKNVLGFEMEKTKRVTMSNWEQERLTSRQIEYASRDAIVGLEVFRAFNKNMGICEINAYRDVSYKRPKIPKDEKRQPQPEQQPPPPSAQHPHQKRSRRARRRQAQHRNDQQWQELQHRRQSHQLPALHWQAQHVRSRQVQGQMFTEF